MYGGGFATVPAYLADMFGTQFVGAIHGRLLTAWSTAGIIGPVVVNYIRESQLAAGRAARSALQLTMYILCGMLVVGLICNFLVKPVNPKWYMSEDEVAKLQATSAAGAASGSFWHRQRRLGLESRGLLGIRRHTAGLGRLDHAQECDPDFLSGIGGKVWRICSLSGVTWCQDLVRKKKDAFGVAVITMLVKI